LVGKFAKHRVEKGLEKKMGDGLEPGWAGIVAIYDRSKAGTVDDTLVSALKKSTAHIDATARRPSRRRSPKPSKPKGSQAVLIGAA
jgi:hypothetical protein